MQAFEITAKAFSGSTELDVLSYSTSRGPNVFERHNLLTGVLECGVKPMMYGRQVQIAFDQAEVTIALTSAVPDSITFVLSGKTYKGHLKEVNNRMSELWHANYLVSA
jgi:hypothetical protein